MNKFKAALFAVRAHTLKGVIDPRREQQNAGRFKGSKPRFQLIGEGSFFDAMHLVIGMTVEPRELASLVHVKAFLHQNIEPGVPDSHDRF